MDLFLSSALFYTDIVSRTSANLDLSSIRTNHESDSFTNYYFLYILRTRTLGPTTLSQSTNRATSATTTTLSKLSAADASGPPPATAIPWTRACSCSRESVTPCPPRCPHRVRCIEETRLHLPTSPFTGLWISSAHDSGRAYKASAARDQVSTTPRRHLDDWRTRLLAELYGISAGPIHLPTEWVCVL